jgi:hypothetical protein
MLGTKKKKPTKAKAVAEPVSSQAQIVMEFVDIFDDLYPAIRDLF